MMKSETNDTLEIYKTSKYKYSTSSSKGIFIRVVYRFRNDRTGSPIGIQLSVDDTRKIRLKIGILNNDNVIIKEFVAWKDEIVKMIRTQLWCYKDFVETYPEYKYYIV